MIEQWLSSHLMRTVTTIGAAVMALGMIAIRVKAAQRPTSIRKIIIPPLAMSTGYLMFAYPPARIPVGYALGAIFAGILLGLPLIRASKLQVIQGEVYLQRSRAFLVVLLGLFALRMLLHPVVEEYVTLAQSASIFFVLAFGMILTWRIAMVAGYRQAVRQLGTERQPADE